MTNSNNPPVLVEMDPELVEFVLENCRVNMAFLLSNMQSVSRPTAEALVALNENYRKLRDATNKAVKEAEGGNRS